MAEPLERLHLRPFEKKIHELSRKGLIFADMAVDWEGAANFNREILYMAMAKLKAQDKAPIWVYLMSPGGIVQCGFAMHDIIKSVTGLGVEVNGLATGVVASMAMAVLQAMTRRYSLPNTQFMLHEVSQVMGSSQAKLTEAEEMQAEHKRMNAIVMGILAERSGMPAAKIMEQIKKKDVWLDPSKAKKFGPKGLIDEIVDTLPIQLV